MSWPKFGIENAIHTLRKQYEKTNSDAVLLIDAENALQIYTPFYTTRYTELIN